MNQRSENRNSFEWVAVYQEIARKLLQLYEQKETERLLEVFKNTFDAYTPVENVWTAVGEEYMDPFTFFARFNLGGNAGAQRPAQIEKIMEQLGIECPFDGDLGGIPTIDSRSGYVFAHSIPDAQDAWKLFATAMAYADDRGNEDLRNSFSILCQKWIDTHAHNFKTLTNVLYMMRPDAFFPAFSETNIGIASKEYGVQIESETPRRYLESAYKLESVSDKPFWETVADADPHFATMPNSSLKSSAVQNQPAKDGLMNQKMPLNTILYGPPGTGKTYQTKAYAVAICEPEKFGQVDELLEKMDKSEEVRKRVKKCYETLVEQGRIAFTTFHQSYSYEDFVEGIRPSASGEAISYSVEPGVFKRFCGENKGFKECWNKLLDEVAKKEEAGEYLEIPTKSKRAVLTLALNASGRGLQRVGNGNPEQTYFNEENCLGVYRSGKNVPKGGNNNYREAIVSYMKDHLGLEDYIEDNQARVFIIDEINRGNVSAIFGELITLLEDDKRIGGSEEPQEITLPYSKEPWGIPGNVYIIGTMNTADKSLTQIDTALRRRFSFKEVMPEPKLLESLEGINLGQLLEAINERIEALLDRDHVIGHAYLMPHKVGSLKELQTTFARRIIPLLQEYFFNDYDRIRAVLNDPDGTFILKSALSYKISDDILPIDEDDSNPILRINNNLSLLHHWSTRRPSPIPVP